MVECFLDSGQQFLLSILSDSVKDRIRRSNVPVMGANGSPLDVMGMLDIRLHLGRFQNEHKFSVVRELTIECLLGADFMEKNDVLIDCRRKCLQLGSNAVEVSFIDSLVKTGL